METYPMSQTNTASPTTTILSRHQILSTASSILQAYPSFTNAFLFGPYAKGTARPDSDIDIAVFLLSSNNNNKPKYWNELGGAIMDLEDAFAVNGKKVDLSVCPRGDFLERIRSYWVPIDIGPRSRAGESIPDTIPAPENASDVIKDRLHRIAKISTTLLEHTQKFGDVDSNSLLPVEQAHIRYCIDNLGDKVKKETLSFDPHVQEYWSKLRDIQSTATRRDDHQIQKVDLTDRIWIPDLLKETKALLAVIEEKLALIDSENA